MADVDGRVSTWNEGAARVFGYEEEEILGADGAILFTPEDRESGAPERELQKARTEGRAEDERWHMRKDGSRFWASGFVRSVLDEEGNLLGFSKVARDLTERKRVEEAVQEVRWAERERLARDLHDLVLQDLTYALQAAQAHRLTRKVEEGEGALNLTAMIDSLRRVSQGLREAVYELRAGEAVGPGAVPCGGGPGWSGAPTLPGNRDGARRPGRGSYEAARGDVQGRAARDQGGARQRKAPLLSPARTGRVGSHRGGDVGGGLRRWRGVRSAPAHGKRRDQRDEGAHSAAERKARGLLRAR